jgi:thiamine kinase-like enzyme
MPPRDIEELCRAIVPGAGSVAIEPLGVGLLSETYRVARQGAAYTLKVAVARRPELGVDLSWEARLLARAADAALAPRLAYADPQKGVLLAEWISGRPWTSADARVPAGSLRVAALLRRVHCLEIPLPARVITPMQWIDLYRAALSRLAAPLPDATLDAAASARGADFARLTSPPNVVCHSDLHALNLIERNGELILLDWEYAHAADPLWDLAGWSANNDLKDESQRQLLMHYLGRAPPAKDWQRFRLLLWLYDYVCLLWSRLYLFSQGLDARGRGPGEIADRATFLDARLRLAAHYAA